MGKFKDLTGQKFGKLTVIKRVEDYVSPKGHREPQWLCECDCEKHNMVVVRRSSLTNQNTQSCGCTGREKLIFRNKNGHKTNQYDISGDFGIGWTTNTNEEFYFDLEDYALIKDYCWSERVDHNGYHMLIAWDSTLQKVIKMTHLIKGINFDHIDRNPLNNRKENLRESSHMQNSQNRSIPKNNKSGVIGVYYDTTNDAWKAQITVDKVIMRLGTFHCKHDAIVARLTAEKKYFGEFSSQQHLYEQYNIV